MNLLINCSNLQGGGGIQVADSICCDLERFKQHFFVVVIPKPLERIIDKITTFSNVQVIRYDFCKNVKVFLTGRDAILDALVKRYKIEAVLTIFGPAYWKPKCPHLCGFARAHWVLQNDFYFKQLTTSERLKTKLFYSLLGHFFKQGVSAFYTENAYISDKLQARYPGIHVFTVTNYYNQIYDHPEEWQNWQLPSFNGFTFLCVSAYRAHKNLEISMDMAKKLRQLDPSLAFRFVFTFNEEEFPPIPADLKSNFVFTGPVDVRTCPSLYKQADIMFQPTLIECFTATYPEAMTMEVPIVTTNLEFARGLCGDAAVYYHPMDADDAVKVLMSVLKDGALRERLIQNGKQQLLKFDNYSERTNKLISILEKLN